jgi:hypothetical protein
MLWSQDIMNLKICNCAFFWDTLYSCLPVLKVLIFLKEDKHCIPKLKWTRSLVSVNMQLMFVCLFVFGSEALGA